mmetsp:Transcript_5489/g.12161  ORF Transcript_5489/g.12161 Transcript_5489/m.12161 type:complete len:118 (-) Transcript_5489:375-728(-)
MESCPHHARPPSFYARSSVGSNNDVESCAIMNRATREIISSVQNFHSSFVGVRTTHKQVIPTKQKVGKFIWYLCQGENMKVAHLQPNHHAPHSSCQSTNAQSSTFANKGTAEEDDQR